MADITINTELQNCSLAEISGIAQETPKDVVEEIANQIGNGDLKCGAILFTSANGRKVPAPYGERLRDYIEQNSFGTVTKTPTYRNPNTGRYITTYVWVVDQKAMNKLYDRIVAEESGDSYEAEPYYDYD